MSTRSEHTPGPWYYHKNINIHDQGLVISEATGENVAVSYNHKADDTPIIAAAPELLDALKYLTDVIEYENLDSVQRDAVDQARAAIRKAEGE